MSKNTHRTALGRPLDMASLRLQNENVRAVGNMKVNARGDMVDDMNRVISSKTDQVNRMYQSQTNNKKR